MAPTLAAVTLALIAQFVAGQEALRTRARVRLQTLQIAQEARVFQTPQGTHQLQRESATLCTTPILRPSTNVDPKIVVEPPKTDAKIRTIDAGKCIERASR